MSFHPKVSEGVNQYSFSIGGYPKHSTFGSVVGGRSAAGREEFLQYHNAAIEIPSPAIHRIEQISKETGVFIVSGVIERDGGTLYCTAVFIEPMKGLVGKHRKLVKADLVYLVLFISHFKHRYLRQLSV